MPYRINPKNTKEVQVFKGGRWQTLKRHSSPLKARKHLVALKINVEEKSK